MEENKNEAVNDTGSENTGEGKEFENLGKHEIEIGRRVHEGHKHRHRHHHSSSRSSGSESKSRKKKSKKKSNKPKSGFWSNFLYYSLRVWVVILTGVIVWLLVWNYDLASKLRVHSDQLENVGNVNSGILISGASTESDYVVPDYWRNAVDDAAEKVQALMDSAGRDAVAFAWFSDLHYSNGSKNNATGAITAAVMDKCNIPFALSTGDVLTQSVLLEEQEVALSYKLVYEMLSPIGSDRLLQVEGNHDGAWGQVDLDDDGELETGERYCYNVTEEKLYNMMFRQHQTDTRRVYGSESTWFYIDDPVTKTRFIMLNNLWTNGETDSETGIAVNNKMSDKGFGQPQVDWLINEALVFEERGWSVVMAAHVPLNSEQLRDRAVVQGLLEAYANKSSYSGEYGVEGQWDHVKVSVDYKNRITANIIGFYAGHIHADSIKNFFSFPQVTITPNSNISYDENEEEREWGTDNEVAVDFVVINKKTGEVNHVRLGVGSDRTYNYK
ncbi:MAG: hypothetical protein IJA52_03955 [Clostridia bacterium]|nr:hypothetical protein [Clostridia bacterium]